jgi:hypothetical protein
MDMEFATHWSDLNKDAFVNELNDCCYDRDLE